MAVNFPVKTAVEWREYMCRMARNRSGGDIDVAANSYHWNLFSAVGEAFAIQSQAAKSVASSIPLSEMSEADLQAKYGATIPRNLETNSSGYIAVECAATGTTIQAGDTLTFADTGELYAVTASSPTTHADGDSVAIRSVDPGSGTNITAKKSNGTSNVLVWNTIRAGCYASAAIVELPSGDGISGGRDIESVEEWRARISDRIANPAGHGNESDIIALIEDATGRTLSTGEVTPGHGVPVQKGFCYPALLGPGTVGIAFLIKQDDWWKSRAPTSQQITTVYTYVDSYLPKYSILPLVVLDTANVIDISVELDSRSVQWADFSPWPAYTARDSGCKVIAASPAPTATAFTIATDDADYTGETNPTAGQSIAVFDETTGTFKRKILAAVSGSGPWDVTVSSASGSDNTFIPVAGTSVSPWSDVLPEVAMSIGTQIGSKFGVGEAVANSPGDGVRQIRVPLPAFDSWPYTVDSRIAYQVVDEVAAVKGATFLAVQTPDPPHGIDAVYVFRLTDIGVFKT